MRTTIAIDDDVLAAVKELANTERKSIGEIMSSLARTALRHRDSTERVRNGVPLLPVSPNAPKVTSGFVKQLAKELGRFGTCLMSMC